MNYKWCLSIKGHTDKIFMSHFVSSKRTVLFTLVGSIKGFVSQQYKVIAIMYHVFVKKKVLLYTYIYIYIQYLPSILSLASVTNIKAVEYAVVC